MKRFKLFLILVVLLLPLRVLAADESPETKEPLDYTPGTDAVYDGVELPEGLEVDSSGNVEEAPTPYSVTLKLPQDLVGSRISVLDPLGNTTENLTVSSTGEVSYSYSEPQNINLVLQGEVEGQDEPESGVIPVELVVLIVIAASLVVALLAFLGGRVSALHVLKDLREYVYDKNLD